MPIIPGIENTRRYASDVDPDTHSIRIPPVKPISKEFSTRIKATQATVETSIADIRTRVGSLTRHLLLHGGSLSLSPTECDEVTKSIRAFVSFLELSCATLQSLKDLAASDLWVSPEIEAITKDMANILYSCTDLNAYRELPASLTISTTYYLSQYCDILKQIIAIPCLLRDVSKIESERNTEEFNRLMVDPVPQKPGPNPADLLLEKAVVALGDVEDLLPDDGQPVPDFRVGSTKEGLTVETSYPNPEDIKKALQWAADSQKFSPDLIPPVLSKDD